MKITGKLAVSQLLVFLLAIQVIAQNKASTDTVSSSPDLLKILDSNGDGILEPYEALDSLLAIQSQYDDKQLTMTMIGEIVKQQEEKDRQEMTDLLQTLDRNGDQRTELREVDPEMRGFVAGLDLNKDGLLTIEEALRADFGDDMLLSDEALSQEVKEVFADYDKDRDGQISRAEAGKKVWRRFRESDRDGSRSVSKDEFKTFLKINNQTAWFTIKDGVAVMSGVIGADTPARVLELVYQHPEIRTIQMDQVPGSMDDEANLRAARYIRRFGFKTIIKSDGMIASGGTDFFLAGKERKIESGAKLGIHSWGGPGYQGKDVPRDDPQHRLYLDYYEEMGIPAEFYWRTLEAAPADDIHWMTAKELDEFKFERDSSNGS